MPPDVGARVPKTSLHVPGFVVLYRNQPVEDDPFGIADPLTVAPVPEMAVAGVVVTAGAAVVVNESTVPNDAPATFCAIAQK